MDRSENPDFNYANWAFEQNPAGVVSWAFKGLLKLLKNEGKYSTFKSDRNAVREWQSSRDHVQQFLNDIESGEGSIGIKKTAEKDPKKGTASSLILWQKFVIWHGVAYGSAPKFGKIVYYRTLQEKGFKKEKFEDGYVFWGLCVTEK